ncbi:MAG: [protein-PII] uridylyltransferase [Sphingomonadales bacterium]
MAPYSDVDLLFLLPYKQTAWGEQVVEYMLYMLWDLGVKVGHATRTADECVRLANQDLSICTALLEARYLWGDRALYDDLVARFEKDVFAGTGPEFVEKKLAERDARHKRLGDSRYLVEPNLKEGKGGLRDLHTLFWIAKYLYRVRSIGDLVDKGVFSPEELAQFRKASDFLWTVRVHLHLVAGRAEERITFDVQRELARRLNYTDRPKSLGVERFMKHYYLTAKDVGDLTRIFCAHLEEEHKRKPRLRLPRFGLRRKAIDGFQVEGERLDIGTREDIKKDPVRMLRLFRVAQEHDLDIHPHALRLIRQNLPLINRTVQKDPEANELFMDMLTAVERTEETLKRLNEAGVFGKFIPDFGRVVAQMQHDMYHVYTVDEHTIRAIGLLQRVEQGTLAEDHPLANGIIHKIVSRRVLYVAVLLHDIAKGRGGDHSVLGARVAERLCPRLGMTPAETEQVAWLVRWHLLMSSYAFKRDVTDPKTVTDFARLVKSPERLRLLLVLTVVDIRAVGPNIWNGWKGQLLRDLYYASEEVLLGGYVDAVNKARVAAVRDTLRGQLGGWTPEEIADYFQRLPDSYWLASPVENQLADARMIREADQNGIGIAVDFRADDFRDVTQITVYVQDHPGLFARLSGALAISGASIADAKIFTTKDGMALDSFWVQDLDRSAINDPEKIARLEDAIRQTLSGEILPARKLAEKSALPKRTDVFKVAPAVYVDNRASNSHTVIEVNGRDRPGLLFDLARAFYDLNLSIASAHVATYGERAVDVFYVRDLFGHKVIHPNKIRAIEERLTEALGSGTTARTNMAEAS